MTNSAYFILVGLEMASKFFLEFIKYLAFFRVYIEVYIVKSKHFPFSKQSLAFFNYKHLATMMQGKIVLGPT